MEGTLFLLGLNIIMWGFLTFLVADLLIEIYDYFKSSSRKKRE